MMTEEEEREVARMQADLRARSEELLVGAYRHQQRMGVRTALVFGGIMLVLVLLLCGIPSAIITAIFH